jgi:hypothetical protein
MRENPSSFAALQLTADVLSIENEKHSAQKPPPESWDKQSEKTQPSTSSEAELPLR